MAERIERLVARRAGVARDALGAAGRGGKRLAMARHAAMYLQRVLLERPYEDIGARFSRHASTVFHACRRIEAMRDDARFDAWLTGLEREVGHTPGENAR